MNLGVRYSIQNHRSLSVHFNLHLRTVFCISARLNRQPRYLESGHKRKPPHKINGTLPPMFVTHILCSAPTSAAAKGEEWDACYCHSFNPSTLFFFRHAPQYFQNTILNRVLSFSRRRSWWTRDYNYTSLRVYWMSCRHPYTGIRIGTVHRITQCTTHNSHCTHVK